MTGCGRDSKPNNSPTRDNRGYRAWRARRERLQCLVTVVVSRAALDPKVRSKAVRLRDSDRPGAGKCPPRPENPRLLDRACAPGATATPARPGWGAERGLGVNTLTLRRAAICYLHVVAGCPVPTAGILRRIVAPMAAALAGLRLTLPHSKGERTGRGVTVAIPYGNTELCPVRALRHWQQAAATGLPVPASTLRLTAATASSAPH